MTIKEARLKKWKEDVSKMDEPYKSFAKMLIKFEKKLARKDMTGLIYEFHEATEPGGCYNVKPFWKKGEG